MPSTKALQPAASLRASARVLRNRADALLILLTGLHGLLLVTVPWAPLIALGLWWNANTVSHNFIHRPFFRSRTANRFFSVYLSLFLGLPQTLWRDRHLAHHANRSWRWRWSAPLVVELIVVVALWLVLATMGWRFLLGTCVAGWLGGMLLCTLQGHFEHVRGTVSHYGKLYNLAFFNDGYHAEHHARPGLHWTELPAHVQAGVATSAWPAVLRWLERAGLEGLERLVLRSAVLQRYVLLRHHKAFARLLRDLPPPRQVAIVGGGLFPRTALILQKLLPEAELTIIDHSARNIERARERLNGKVKWLETSYSPALCEGADLLVVPLAFQGDRRAFYEQPPALVVIVHDWIWQRRGQSQIVSWLLLKRVNLTRA